MEKILLALGAIALLGSVMMIASQQGQVESSDLATQFNAFKVKYNKKYGSQEESFRLQVYANNVQYAENFNKQKGQEVFGETMFFDLTDEEFAQIYLIDIVPEQNTERVTLYSNSVANSVDWRQKGAVTPVKDQGQCGSCWAFSTTGVIEGWLATTTGELPSLSEQQIVDCAGFLYGNFGCNGGMPGRALNYVARHGLQTEDTYSYTARQGSCQNKDGSYKVNGHTDLTASEASLVSALNQQPVSVAVDATNWKYYDPSKQEVFSDCAQGLNHAVLAVGYTEEYFVIKNSWASSWGKDGYIHLARGNTCGVTQAMTVPK